MRKSMIFRLFLLKLVVLFENAAICQGIPPPAFVTIGKFFLLSFFFCELFSSTTVSCSNTGAVFSDQLQADYEIAFRLAIDTINNDNSVLPNTELKVIVNKSATLDAFKNIEKGKYLMKVCLSKNFWFILLRQDALIRWM